jgi:hypothetical protein
MTRNVDEELAKELRRFVKLIRKGGNRNIRLLSPSKMGERNL